MATPSRRCANTRRDLAEFFEGLTMGLGAVAMLVGGTGILALMLLSVKERTGEIGLRLAVGATPGDVFTQFLGEATALALGGWAAGLALGGLGAAALAGATGWSVALPAGAAVASFVLAAAIGLGFGALPARRAAQVPPLQAIAG